VEKTEKQKMTALARQRSNIYGLLATVFRQEVTSDFLQKIKDPQFMGVLSHFGIDWTNYLSQPEEQLLDELAVEYARLFLGPGKHISPHDSQDFITNPNTQGFLTISAWSWSSCNRLP
jgi:TorA maturation chaperone TorD